MKKVYIFGASVGGKKFLENSNEPLNVLGFLDNDLNKQGKLFEGYQVFSPDIIFERTDYDYVVVTSMYIDSIYKQLRLLSVDKERILFPPKKMLKLNKRPFEKIEMRNNASELLCLLATILKNYNYYISFGTLLGIVREGDLLAWDDDIDISIRPSEVDLILDTIISNIEPLSKYHDLKVYKRMFTSTKIANISIHCYINGEDSFHISLACLNSDEVNKDMYMQEVNITPKAFFASYDIVTYKNTSLKVPKNYISYLEYTYGDWKVPKKETSFFDNSLSYKESQKVTNTIKVYDYMECEKSICNI